MIKKVKLFEAFRRAMLSNPKGSRKEQYTEFMETVRSDPGYLDLLAEDYFYRQAQTWETREIEPGSHAIVGTPAMQRRVERSAEQRAESAKRTAKMQEELAATIRPFIFLEMEMPNGKKLRNCTGAELAKFGGAFLEMSTYLKPTEVVDKHLSEKNLRDIFSRHDSPKSSKGRGRDLHA